MADPELIAEFKELEKQKAKLEAEIEGLHAFLTEDGMPGVSGPLVDEEGFPRGDIDVYAVRTARNRLACAQTDHVELMKKIEKALQAIHAGSRVDVPRAPAAPAAPAAAAAGGAPSGVGTLIELQLPPAPFALIDEVAEGSPAQEAGVSLGDQICCFGHVNLQDTGDLQACFAAIQQLVPASVGQAVPVVVLRGQPPERVTLQLTPKQWTGRGLLGCHMAPKIPS